MSCECENIECLRVSVSPCATGVSTGLTASETGSWTGIIEFNGIETTFSFTVISGQDIIIPNSNINENYRHLLRLYNSRGILFNGTCYTLNTFINNISPVAFPAYEIFEYHVTIAGNSITNTHFGDGEILLLVTDAQDYNTAFFTQSGATITSKNDGDDNPLLSFYVGQTITVIMKLLL